MFCYTSKNNEYLWLKCDLFYTSKMPNNRERYEYHTIDIDNIYRESVWYNYYIETNYYEDLFMFAYIDILHIISDCIWRSLDSDNIKELINNRLPFILQLIQKKHHFDLLHTIVKSRQSNKRDFCIELFDDQNDKQQKWCLCTIIDLNNTISEDYWMNLNFYKRSDTSEDWWNIDTPEDHSIIYNAHNSFCEIKLLIYFEIENWLKLGITDKLFIEWNVMSQKGLLPHFELLKDYFKIYIQNPKEMFLIGQTYIEDFPASKIYDTYWGNARKYIVSDNYTWEIIGDALIDWSIGIKIKPHSWIIISTSGGEIKFRINESWEINFGQDPSFVSDELSDSDRDIFPSGISGRLIPNGENIYLDSGKYLIILNRNVVLLLKINTLTVS